MHIGRAQSIFRPMLAAAAVQAVAGQTVEPGLVAPVNLMTCSSSAVTGSFCKHTQQQILCVDGKGGKGGSCKNKELLRNFIVNLPCLIEQS